MHIKLQEDLKIKNMASNKNKLNDILNNHDSKEQNDFDKIEQTT